MPSKIDSPFKDYVAPEPSFTVKPTLGNTVGQPTDGTGTGVPGTVSPKELPSTTNDLWHGPRA